MKTQDKSNGFAAQGEEYIKHLLEKIDPKDRDSLDRIVIAGQKVMFSKETHKYMLSMLDSQGEMSDKLGIGIVELLGLLFQQSKGNLPPHLAIPAGSILLVKACEYVEKTGGEMNIDIFSDAMTMMVTGIKKYAQEMESQGQQPQGAPPAQGAQQPPAQGAAQAPAQGLLSQAQGV